MSLLPAYVTAASPSVLRAGRESEGRAGNDAGEGGKAREGEKAVRAGSREKHNIG